MYICEYKHVYKYISIYIYIYMYDYVYSKWACIDMVISHRLHIIYFKINVSSPFNISVN
jgi:hypothetical protein